MMECFLTYFSSKRIHCSKNDKDFSITNDQKDTIQERCVIPSFVENFIKTISKEESNLMSADISMTSCIKGL